MPSGRRAAVALVVAAVFTVGFASSYGSDDVSNRPPTLGDIPTQTVDELSALTFTATDRTAPAITLIGSDQVTVELGSTYTEDGATCYDEPDGALNANSTGTVDTSTVGVYHITYTCADQAGNQATPLTRTVTVPDRTIPNIILAGSAEVTVKTGDDYTDLGATCHDEFDDSPTVRVASSNVDTSVAGTYQEDGVAPSSDARKAVKTNG